MVFQFPLDKLFYNARKNRDILKVIFASLINSDSPYKWVILTRVSWFYASIFCVLK
jgi:hypothetical protein